jgi:hypothetical protein
MARQLNPALPISVRVAETLAAGHLAYMRNIRVAPSQSEVPQSTMIIAEVGALLTFAEGLQE